MDETALIITAKELGINIEGLSSEQIYAAVEEQGRLDAKAEIVDGGLNRKDFVKGLAPYLAYKGYGVAERNLIINREWNKIIGKKN